MREIEILGSSLKYRGRAGVRRELRTSRGTAERVGIERRITAQQSKAEEIGHEEDASMLDEAERKKFRGDTEPHGLGEIRRAVRREGHTHEDGESDTWEL